MVVDSGSGKTLDANLIGSVEILSILSILSIWYFIYLFQDVFDFLKRYLRTSTRKRYRNETAL